VLYDSGGFSPATGNPSQIYVLRAATDPAAFGAVTAWHLDARNAVVFTLATKFEMRPDDIVFVEEQPITTWNRTIQQSIPALITGTANAVN
jgi:polysaccharide export outer membrane protein